MRPTDVILTVMIAVVPAAVLAWVAYSGRMSDRLRARIETVMAVLLLPLWPASMLWTWEFRWDDPLPIVLALVLTVLVALHIVSIVRRRLHAWRA